MKRSIGQAELAALDLRRIRAWILRNGMGIGDGSLHFYGFDGTETVFRFSDRTVQKALVNSLVLQDNGEEQLSVFAEQRPFAGYASGQTAGNWHLAAKQFSNFLFYRDRDFSLFSDTHLSPTGPGEWVTLLNEMPPQYEAPAETPAGTENTI